MLLAEEIGMSKEFASQLLNILFTESEDVQVQKNPQKPAEKKLTHLGIFAKAKQLEASGKEIIHMEVGEPDYPSAWKSRSGSWRIFQNGTISLYRYSRHCKST